MTDSPFIEVKVTCTECGKNAVWAGVKADSTTPDVIAKATRHLDTDDQHSGREIWTNQESAA